MVLVVRWAQCVRVYYSEMAILVHAHMHDFEAEDGRSLDVHD
jgi:hypothetical protein